MIDINFNFEEMIQGLDEASGEYQNLLERGFARANLQIIHKFQDEQLSGRRSGDVGLNVRTGNLRDSLHSVVTVDSEAITATIYNRGADYWAYHQDGSDRLRKRLFIEEDFEDSGEKLYSSEIEIAMQALG
jgi:hypothetical protein